MDPYAEKFRPLTSQHRIGFLSAHGCGFLNELCAGVREPLMDNAGIVAFSPVANFPHPLVGHRPVYCGLYAPSPQGRAYAGPTGDRNSGSSLATRCHAFPKKQ